MCPEPPGFSSPPAVFLSKVNFLFFFFFVNLPPVHPLLLHAPCELCPLSLNPQHRPKYNLKTINNNEGMLRLSSELQTLQTKKKTSKENMTEKQSGGFTHVDISDFTVRQLGTSPEILSLICLN